FPDVRASYTRRDTMLYGLGIAACRDPLDERQLRFVYEGALQALPSMSCVLAHAGFWIREPELEANWVKLVHAEQSFELSAPLPAEGELIGKYRITGVVDKGPQTGALLYFEKSLYTTDDVFVGKVASTYFLRGDGGCGSWGKPNAELPTVPTRAPTGS